MRFQLNLFEDPPVPSVLLNLYLRIAECTERKEIKHIIQPIPTLGINNNLFNKFLH